MNIKCIWFEENENLVEEDLMAESNLSKFEKLDRIANGYRLDDLWPLPYPDNMQYQYTIEYMLAHFFGVVKRAISKNVLVLNNEAYKIYEIMKED